VLNFAEPHALPRDPRLRVIAAAFLLAAATAMAEPFPLGRTDLAPAPGARWNLAAASNGTGHLAVWRDGRDSYDGDIWATRLLSDGRPLDGEGLRLGHAYGFLGERPLVATDMQDYLVVWTGRFGGLQSARVTRAGAVSIYQWTPDGVWAYQDAYRLASNGRSYLLIFQDRERPGLKAVLLDRHGVPKSGEIRLDSDVRSLVGTRFGTWLISVRDDGSTRIGVLREELFPRSGASVRMPPLPSTIERAYELRLARDSRGVYSIRRYWTGARYLLIYQRHDEQSGEPLGLPVKIPWPLEEAEDLVVSAVGRALYVAWSARIYDRCQTRQLKLIRVGENGEVENLELPGGAKPDTVAAILEGPAGPLLLWSDRRYGGDPCAPTSWPSGIQLYAAVIHGSHWQNGGTVISLAQRAQRSPRLMKGPQGHLAVWIETDVTRTLVARLIDPDGRPVTEPLVVASDPEVNDPLIAFDGERFLVAWNDSIGARARFVAPDGQPLGDAFALEGVSVDMNSLFWDGSQYVVTSENVLHRLSRSGAAIAEPVEAEDVELYLAACAGCDQPYAGVGVDAYGSVVSGGPPYFADYYSLAVGGPPDDDGCLEEPVIDYYGAAWYWVRPAVAASPEGHVLRIVHDGWTGSLHLLPGRGKDKDPLPYGMPYTWYRRLHAEWNGAAFVVAAGPSLAVHAPDGKVLRVVPLLGDVYESAVAVNGTGSATVLYQRGEWTSASNDAKGRSPRIEAIRIDTR
jgi:hypothetical protein